MTDRRRLPETITLDDLPSYGLTLVELRRLSITKYGPPESPYWLLADLVAVGLVLDTVE
jgi:hypothetical protein